jgi:hypothetical protein
LGREIVRKGDPRTNGRLFPSQQRPDTSNVWSNAAAIIGAAPATKTRNTPIAISLELSEAERCTIIVSGLWESIEVMRRVRWREIRRLRART